MAVPREVRRDLLPQRDDLFRRRDQVDAGRAFHAETQAGWLALYRSFGIADRLASRTAAGRPHDLPEDGMSTALAHKQPVGAASGEATPGRRFFDNTHSAWMVKVFPGEFYVTKQPDEIPVTVLGSCVSACIRDPVLGVGGMNHFMLAKSRSGGWGNDPQSARFGNFAMEKLINELLKVGCSRERMEIKVFG